MVLHLVRPNWKICSHTLIAVLLWLLPAWAQGNRVPVIVVSAEGLSDPNYYVDKTVAFDEALRDAKRQAVEKAVGCFVSSHTIVENYTLVRDQFISKTEGLIKSVLKTVNGGVQDDGFYHVWIKAEVYARPMDDTVRELSRDERIAIIRQDENPIVSVGLTVVYPDMGRVVHKCQVCDTEIRNRLKQFGYKVISEDQAKGVQEQQIKLMVSQGFSKAVVSTFTRKASDISVTGRIKLKKSPVVEISGLRVQTTLLTAWSLEATDNHTSEIIFARNFRPARGEMFNDEDEAIMGLGERIGQIFSRDLFKDHVMRPTHTIMLTVSGIEKRAVAKLFKKDLLGIRAVINVTFREFLAGGDTVFEVEFAGNREYLTDIIDSVMLKALNRKYGENAFRVQEEHGDVLRLSVDSQKLRQPFSEILETGVPIQLAGDVPAERLQEVVKSKALKEKVVGVNKDAKKALVDL